MKKRKLIRKTNNQTPVPERGYHGRIFSAPDQDKCLDSVQLHKLEQSFRDWTEAASRGDVRMARRRILLIFLLIRYTAAKLSEVLGLNPSQDIDFENHFVRFGRIEEESGRPPRKVQLCEKLCREIQAIIADSSFKKASQNLLDVDPGFVRNKFYERAEACGIAKQLGAPENLRKSRAVELMQNNMPLPAVQVLLGHSTPNFASSYVSFSEDDIQQVIRLILEKESARKTSARNSFFGKIQTIQQGDIQTRVELVTMGGHRVTTVITNHSLQRLALKMGNLITAEVKAPWVILHKSINGPECSADNMFNGIVERIIKGEINTEYIVRISDGTEVCSIATSESCRRLALEEGDKVWVVFNGFSVVLLSE
ncbi:MAG TPA: TOBE domain-containing protein [Deltaproteobacteria bacterium]|nr:TOBE domain-containing protein [Deltaproteobacteria bacterium]